MIRIVLVLLSLTLASAAQVLGAEASVPSAKPNIVFILADDLGTGDLGADGSQAKTPNIDSIGKAGVRFTQFYASAPECSPTRTAFLTGRYPQRVGGLECAIGVGNVGRYDDAIRLADQHDLGLPVEEYTLPRMLKDAGYAAAIVGKWHVGYEPKFHPLRHGFDSFFGPLGGNSDYFTYVEEDGFMNLYRGEQPAKEEGYLTDLITRDAVAYLKQPHEKPFLLYVPYTCPHTPIQAPDNPKEIKTPETYRKMIERMDKGVGQILSTLEANGYAKNTLVIFTSDNGGTKLARNEPFSGTKGQTFEGGIRVPCSARWPGVIEPGTTCDVPAITMDWTRSLARVAGATLPDGKSFDGVDILAVATGKQPAPERPLFWRLRRGENTRRAVRVGHLKLIVNDEGSKHEEFLFDLSKDVGEKKNLLESLPEDAGRLKSLLAAWEKEVKPKR